METTRRPLLPFAWTTLSLLAVLGYASAQTAPAEGAARVVAEQPVWDAGRVARGEAVVHEFVLRNEGSAPLYVREVRPACGCTVASFDETIPPGGRGVVRVELDTETFRGPIAKDVTVFTNDAATPQLQLTLKGDVRPRVDAQPGYFRFLHVQGEPAVTLAQTIWSSERADLRVLAAGSPLPHLTVAVRPAAAGERVAEASGAQWVVTATLASDAPEGPLTGDVVVRTDDPEQPTLALPIAGYVRPQVMLTPPRVDFGRFPPGEPRKASFLLTNHGAQPVRVLGVDSEVAGLTARLAEREKGKRYDVHLTLVADRARGPFAGRVKVRTDSPRHPVLEVAVHGEVR